MRTLALATTACLCLQCTGDVVPEMRELPTPAAEGSLGANLFATPDGRVLLSWIERRGGERHALVYAVMQGDGWSAPRPIAEGGGWFVNWADFPSVVALPNGSLAAHWLVKHASEPHAYDVRIARSPDGARWSVPVTPHRDGTPTEHGFVSLFPGRDGGLGAAWLDGRQMAAPANPHAHGDGPMSLRYADIASDGALRDEALLDPRVCDCCQTGAAMTADGPIVVYRDRSSDELRDIAVVAKRGRAWGEPRGLPPDRWRISGCPVNGPAVSAKGARVAVAWFTAANGTPRVKLALSADSGATFGMPVEVDDGSPVGRVDAVLLDDGAAVVSWVESTVRGRSLRVRRVGADGSPAPSVTVVAAGHVLGNCFPQMARNGKRLVLAWTAGRVRTAVVDIP